jgi:opacity protein-like surface antigen
MRTLKIALLATAATAALSSATVAADLIIADPIIDNMYSVGFDWEGPYAGLWISGQTTPAAFGLGANLGVNALIDQSLLAGVEASIAWINSTPSSWQGQLHGKLGFVADQAVIYGLLGIGFNSETDAYVPIGVGVEFAVADNLTLKAEYQYQWDLADTVPGTSESAHVGKVGFNWHF